MLDEAELIGGAYDGLIVRVAAPRPAHLEIADLSGGANPLRYVLGHRGLRLVYVLEELAPRLARS
jgi:hypothetical protein